MAEPAAPTRALQSDAAAGPGEEPRELPVFFIIGIAINALMILAFAVWFVSQWKKQNQRKADVKQE